MDNFFEYLIAFIFIISFLSEIFKKKKGGTKVPPSTSTEGYSDDKIVISDQLEDILKAKKQRIRNREQTEQQGYYKTNTNTKSVDFVYNPEADFRENRYSSYENSKPKESLIQQYERTKKVEKTTSNIPKLDENTGFTQQELLDYENKINEIKKEILNPSSLKDFIIVSEILAKPLSLRKRCQKIL